MKYIDTPHLASPSRGEEQRGSYWLFGYLAIFSLVFTFQLHAEYTEDHSINKYNSLPKYAPDEVIVKFKSQIVTQPNNLQNSIQIRSITQLFPKIPQLSSIYLIKLPKNSDVIKAVEAYRQSEMVEYAEPNYLRHTCEKQEKQEKQERQERQERIERRDELNDFWYKKQWGLFKIQAPEVWKSEVGSPEVIVAVIDTGVDYKHQDLAANIWRNVKEIPNNGLDDDGNGYIDDIIGWDFADAEGVDGMDDYLERDNDPMDETGHGTHVSGIIAAIPNNQVGVAGITWSCRVMALRAGFRKVDVGSGLEDDDVASAIIYAVSNGARIINMSFGDQSKSFLLADVIDYAYGKNCVLVAAAGNEKLSFPLYPAAYKNVISVGASDKNDSKAKFSNYGSGINMVAPGVRIFSTVPDNSYSDWSGTSMAAPHVSAVAALMLSKRKSLSAQQVRDLLLSSAEQISEPLFAGAGRLNALKALSLTDSLVAKISEPQNNARADKSIEIKGSAFGLNFIGYQLEYGYTTTPNRWLPITSLIKKEKHDDLMAKWSLSDLAEGVCTLRLKVVASDDNMAYDKTIIHIDHTPPKIEGFEISDRLHGAANRSFILWRTNEPTKSSIFYRPTWSKSKSKSKSDFSEFVELNSSVISEQHIIELSDLLLVGQYEFFIAAENQSNLKTLDDNNQAYYNFELNRYSLSSDGFESFGAPLPIEDAVSASADLDSDAAPEVVGMKSGSAGYAPVVIYERQDSGAYFQRFTSSEAYRPWAIADVDGDGLMEILGNKEDLTFLLEAPTARAYPSNKIWETKGIWGGQVADLDRDGKLEVVSKNLKTNEIFIYEAVGDNQFFNVAQLSNPTLGKNHIGTRFAIADFDGDGRTEIAAGDEDGDFFVYENVSDNAFRLTWSGETAVNDARIVLAGDLDGDGKAELIIGARSLGEETGTLNQRWVYSVYKSSSNDSFQLLCRQEIMFSRAGLTSAAVGDIDRDGRDELFIATSPNAYLFKMQAGKLVAIWHSVCNNTPHPLIEDSDGDGNKEVIFNQNSELSFFKRENFGDFPRRPWGLEASQIGEDEVVIGWQAISERAEVVKFNLYRGLAENSLILYKTDITGLEVFDSKLERGVTYWYSVSTVSQNGRESPISSPISIQSNPLPKLISAKYMPPLQVILDFDQPMASSALEPSYYNIDGGVGFPSSASFDLSEKRVWLTLKAVPSPGKYLLTVKQTRSKLGAPTSKSASSINLDIAERIKAKYEDLRSVVVYPNPVMPNSQHLGIVTFDHLPERTNISIYDLHGMLIEKLEVNETDRGTKRWHLTNSSSSIVASGVYIYVIEKGGERRVGKIAVAK